jgi:hypothetical protein
MTRRCQHQWDKGTVTYMESEVEVTDLDFRGGNAARDVILCTMYGLSTVTQSCTLCGELRSYTTPGEAKIDTVAVVSTAV